MVVSYHNHTRWSDGTCSVHDQIAAAREAGLTELGISDHYVLSPPGVVAEWTMPLDKLGEYVADMRAAGQSAEGLTFRVGVEADYFPETIDSLREALAQHPFDYVIGSVHYANGFPLDESAKLWEALSTDELNSMWRLYWTRIREMAESRVFDFAAHLDLPKKFGFRPSVDLTEESNAALDAIAAAGMAIEINTAGWSLPAKEAYPSPEILRAARKRNIPLLINADAHTPKILVRGFDQARQLAREAGYTELTRYEKRHPYPIPL
jgi:histidinol-phosphatase (PHP family)